MIDGVTVITLEGSLGASFPGEALGRALSGEVLFDLVDVDGVSPEGARAWQALVQGCPRAQLSFLRVPKAMRDAAREHPCFWGTGRIVSGPDDDDDAARIRARHLPPLAPALEAAVQAVSLRRATERPIEKRVDADATRIRIRRVPPATLRYGRLLEGIEGALELDLRGLHSASETEQARLGRALLGLGPEVTHVRIESCPPLVARMLVHLPRVQIVGGQAPPERSARTGRRLGAFAALAALALLLAGGLSVQHCQHDVPGLAP